jgi:hypothetical protein
MKHKLSLLFYFLLVFISITNAQVNLVNGAAQASVPLFSYADPHNRIGTAISLHYVSGNGLKVNELASEVGTGWALNLGGVITRIQHGEADDQKQDLPYTNDFGWEVVSDYRNNYFPNGYMYSEFSSATEVDNGAGYTRLLTSFGDQSFKQRKKYLADREQDEFSFSFNGRTGSFVIGKNGVIKTLVTSKLKIDKVITDMTASNIRTRISEFQITDESGIKYVFKDLELNELLKYDQGYAQDGYATFYKVYPEDNDFYHNRRVTYGRGMNQYIVSKWYLSEIINPLTNTSITFSYETYDVDLKTSEIFQVSSSGTEASKTHSLTQITMRGKTKRIKTITCNAKEKVQFNYFTTARADFPSGRALSSIAIKYDDQTKYSWEFNYGYFFYNQILAFDDPWPYDPVNNRDSRLCLLSVKKKGRGMSEPPYSFTYNLEHRVPANFSYYHDHWGYTNASAGELYEGYSPQAVVNKDNLSSALTNPQTFRSVSANYAATGILKSIQYPTGGTLSFEYEQNDGLDDQGNFVLLGGVRVKKTIQHDGENDTKNVINEYKYIKADGVSSGWGYESFVYNKSFSTRIYKAGDDFKYPGLFSNVIRSALPDIGKNFATKAMNGPERLAENLDVSLGSYLVSALTQVAQALLINYIVNILQDVFAPDYKDYASTEAYSNPLNTNLLPILYSRVEVIPKSGTDNNGKTVHEFTSKADYSLARPTQSFPYSDAPRCEFWRYGLPTNTYVYSKDNVLLKKTERGYTFYWEMTSDPNFLSQKWGAIKRYFDDQDYTDNVTATSDIAHDFYYPLIGRAELTQTKEYDYQGTNQYALVTTQYEYSQDNYQVKRAIVTNSKGEMHDVYTRYPSDYTIASLATMVTNNILNTPISTESFITKNNTKYQTGGTINEFGQVGGGDIKLLKSYEFQTTTPIDKSGATFNPGVLLPDSRYQEVGSLQYNSLGTQVQMQTNTSTSANIYGYNNKYVIARIHNASADRVAYTSFEDDEYGGWSLSPGGTLINSNVVTGKKTFSGVINKTVPQGDYIVTMWASANCAVNSQTSNPLRVSKRDGSWRYFEWKLTNVTSIQVWGDNFDEVRLYPVGAQMTTYTYDPLVGVTTQADANTRITYYEYDAFDKLYVVRDEDYNVLKKYCYNYKGQAEACNLYKSAPINGTYTKQLGCPPGQVGVPYAVNLPEGQCISSSQQEADDQAQLYAQSLANENGSCITPEVTVTLELSNYTGNYYYVGLTNTQTNESYGTWLFAYEYYVTLNVPEGTYNISVGFDTQPYPAWIGACGYSTYGIDAYFENVYVNYQNRYIGMID